MLLALALGAASLASAETVTLGPDLSQYSDSNTVGCSTNPFSSSPLSAPSCTWASVGLGGGNPQVVFGSGTISQVSVKVGATTGMMKAVLMRSSAHLAGEGESGQVQVSCCTDVAESPPFTPAANSTTTIPVDLTASTEFNPQTSTLAVDYLALSVMESGVPVPAAAGVHETLEGEEGEPPEEVQPSDVVEEPALVLNQPAKEPQMGKGYLLLMDAVFNRTESPHALGGASSGPSEQQALPSTPTPTPGLQAPRLGFPLAGPRLRIEGANALLVLACGKAAACQGTVRLQSGAEASTGLLSAAARGANVKKRKRLITYASGRFSISPGATTTVRLRLSTAGRKLAREHRRLTVWVNATPAVDGTGAQAFSDSLTVRF